MIPNLPNEVWSLVFINLPLADRKCVRLTCHQFYDACNTPNIQRNEVITPWEWKLAFCDVVSLSFQDLLNTYRAEWSIKIDGLVLGELKDASILEFFEKSGSRVYSLQFINCKFVPGLLRSIIEQCQSLQQIVLKYEDVPCDVLDDFVALQNDNVVRSTVRDFTLQLCKAPGLTRSQFLSFFFVFPNMKNVELSIQICKHFDRQDSDSIVDTEFSLPSVYDQLLTMSDQLEKLALHFFCSKPHNRLIPNNSSRSLVERRVYESAVSIETWRKFARIEFQNLKELSLYWAVDLSRIEDISTKNPFHGFDHITHFYAHIEGNDSIFDFLTLLLATVKGLRTLFIQTTGIGSTCNFIETPLFDALLRSKLVTLTLDIAFASLQLGMEEHSLSPNYTLKNLSLQRMEPNSLASFIAYFRSLNSLDIVDLHHEILYNICNCQNDLKRLKVFFSGESFVHSVELHTWLAKKYPPSNRELKNLTHLHIVEKDSLECTLTKFMVNELQLPKLESITFDGVFQSPRANHLEVCHIIGKLAKVRIVRLSLPVTMPFYRWLSLVQALPELRILEVRDDEEKLSSPKLDYQLLFETRPSLLNIYHKNVAYFRNYSSNSVASM